MKQYDPEGYERRQKRRAANKEVKEKQASLGQQLSEHKKCVLFLDLFQQ